mgnify:CR=1 FL=1
MVLNNNKKYFIIINLNNGIEYILLDLPEKNNINQKITMNEYSIHGE